MAQLTITLPDAMAEFVREKVAREGFESPDAYILALLRDAQHGVADEEVEAMLLEAVESGPATPMTREDWDSIRAEVRRRHAARQAQDGAEGR